MALDLIDCAVHICLDNIDVVNREVGSNQRVVITIHLNSSYVTVIFSS